MVVTEEEHLPSDRQQDEAMISRRITVCHLTLSYLVKIRSRLLHQLHHHSGLWFPQRWVLVSGMMAQWWTWQNVINIKLDWNLAFLRLTWKLAHGRPKHTRTLWPSQNKKNKQCSEKENQNSDELPHAKWVCVDKPSAKKRAQAETAAYIWWNKDWNKRERNLVHFHLQLLLN